MTIVVAVDQSKFCDATLYNRLTTAGLTDQDTVMLVHDEQHSCDATVRVLADHPNVEIQSVPKLRGAWHAAVQVADEIETPIALPIDIDRPFKTGSIRILRDRLCHSGAQAAAYTTSQRTSGFALADLLTTPCPPTAGSMVMTRVLKKACASMPDLIAACSERLLPWIVWTNALARGGRVVLEPGEVRTERHDWTEAECRLAAEVLNKHAALIDGSDLLRLKWPATASHWLNQLQHKPIRTRANVQPIDVPPTYTTPRMLDRVVHKIRRIRKGAA